MKHKNIGSRLLMAASFVDNGKTVCDVGCDHGKLSLYLIKEKKARHIIATDINYQPLQKAIDLFETHHLSHSADFLCTDGLQGIENTDDITHVVIAGLGGQTMSDVIDGAEFIKKQKTKLILLPAQNGHIIRKYLYENGFYIIQEKNVAEKGKYYSCINAVYTGEIVKNDIFNTYIGECYKNTDLAALGYIEMILGRLRKKQKGVLIDKGVENIELAKAISKIELIIENIKSIHKTIL